MKSILPELQQRFLNFAIEKNMLQFGPVVTKAGRLSPYFFNAGLIYDGASLKQLADFYAQAIIQSKIKFDMLFGPAYKGITLVAATAMMLSERGLNKNFAYNRKEIKAHGEGGNLIGAPLTGHVLIIDDVISSSRSIRESISLIRKSGASPCGVVLSLDRMEKGNGELSATAEISQEYGIPVFAIANVHDLLALIQQKPSLQCFQEEINAFRKRYGA